MTCWGETRGDLEGTSAGGVDAFIGLVVPPTPAERLTDLGSEVDDLAATDRLNDGQARSLIAKLDAAREAVARGDTTTAIEILRAFIRDVESMIRSGTLTTAEGQALIDAANALITELGG